MKFVYIFFFELFWNKWSAISNIALKIFILKLISLHPINKNTPPPPKKPKKEKIQQSFYFHYPTAVWLWKYCFRSKFSIPSFHLFWIMFLFVLKSPDSINVVFNSWSVRMYGYRQVCEWLRREYLALYNSKINKDRNIKFHTHNSRVYR